MPSVSNYWPANFWQAMNQALAWLYGRQNAFAGNWLADALFTQGAQTQTQTIQPASGLLECGITSLTNYLTGLTAAGAQGSPIAMQQIESICSILPPGLAPDNLLGPDGYPINESGQSLPWGNLLVNGYDVTTAMINSVAPRYWNSAATLPTPGDPNTIGVFAKWGRNAYYPFGSLIVDHNNNVQMALYNGTTENTTDNYPTWPTTPLGALTADGTQIWKLISTAYETPGWLAAGYVFNLLNAQASYRVDVFVKTDVWYYQGSSALQTASPIGGGAYSGAYTWSLAGITQGLLLAVLYPTSVSQPSPGWSGAAIPAGWLAHTNTGVCQVPQANFPGGKLANYKAQVYVKTDIEYLQEDNIPIIVQSDGFHARAGSSVVPGAGTPSVHILFHDPVAGWTEVYDSLESGLAYEGLPLSFNVPTSDPLYVPNPGSTDIPAIQNRSFIYDAALAIIAFSAAGNFTAANKIIQQLDFILANPGYLPSIVLENAEDGSTARWSKTGTGATVTNMSAANTNPEEPPYGAGNVLDFHAGSASDVFTYIGSGFPDLTDTQVSFEHLEAEAATFVFDISIITASGLVTDIQVTSGAAGVATLAGTVITLPIGPGEQGWRTTLVNLATLIPSLVSDTLTKITSFSLTLSAANTDLYFDNLSVGTPQPANSLSFSYDTYNGQVDQAYIRAGAMAWVVYAYGVYMQTSQDYSSWAQLQGMINFLLTLQSSAADLTNGLFYEGYGQYVNPGYQFVPGLIYTVATEHQVDLWFAFQRSARVLSNAAINLLKTAQITGAQATSINSTVATIETAAATIWTNLLANLYVAPGASPGHFAQGVTGSTLDTSQALDASGHWSALLAHANARDDIALQCAEFAYQNFLLTGQTVVKSLVSNSYNQAYAASTPFAGMKPYNELAGTPPVWTKTNDSGVARGSGNPMSTSAFAHALTPGSLIVVAVVNATSGSDSNATPTDTAGNTYHDCGAGRVAGAASAFSLQFFYALNTHSTASNVASVANPSGYLYLIQALEFTATNPIVGIDGAPSATANGNTGTGGGQNITSGPTTTTQNGDLIIGLQDDGDPTTIGPGFTAAVEYDGVRPLFEYLTQSAAGAIAATWSGPNSTGYAAMVVAFSAPGVFGYINAPASVWQEGTWGMILMLLNLYSISGLASFFTGLGTTIDAVLTQLIAGQATILPATGDGSLLAYSLAARNLPYEFEVWPALAPTAWMWLVATNPSLLLTVAGTPQLLSYMYIPQGAEQSVDDKNGSTSVGQMEIHCIDPGGLLHTLAAQQDLIGQIATFSQGFPGLALGDFVPLHVVQISDIAFDADSRVIIKAGDVKRFIQGSMLWPQGGPLEFLPGQKNTWQPSGAQWMPNSYPVSSDNPRWVSGNPLDIFLAAMQNELGVGQDEALLAQIAQGSTGELIAAANPFWAKYLPGYVGTEPIPAGGNPATLINPNPYLDVPGITALRDGQFSGDWFEFKITSPQQARSWLEDQILKPLGLVMVVTSSGQVTLKPMKNPVNQTPVFGFTDSNIIGIPEVSLAAIINALAFRGDVDDSGSGDRTSARTYNTTVPMLQQASFNLFHYLYNHQVEAAGIKTGRGLFLRAFLLGDQLFRRYGFAPPIYQATTQLGALQPELKDWVSLTHRLVPDYVSGGRGVTGIPCEVSGRSPDYANGRMRFTLLDCRCIQATTPYQIAPQSAGIPIFTLATNAQQQQYFFISTSGDESLILVDPGRRGRPVRPGQAPVFTGLSISGAELSTIF